jgi:hypothetical protein
LSLLGSPVRAEELRGLLRNTDLDAPILPWEDPRWERMRSGVDPQVDLHDRYRGAQVGGVIENATVMAQKREDAKSGQQRLL